MTENKRFQGAQKHELHPQDDTRKDFDQNAGIEAPKPYGLTRPAQTNTEVTEESEGQRKPGVKSEQENEDNGGNGSGRGT